MLVRASTVDRLDKLAKAGGQRVERFAQGTIRHVAPHRPGHRAGSPRHVSEQTTADERTEPGCPQQASNDEFRQSLSREGTNARLLARRGRLRVFFTCHRCGW
jgi:hypothetical protein